MQLRTIAAAAAALMLGGCATLTEDAMTPVALSFSDGTSGTCNLHNKRGAWRASIPSVVSVRKSDDPLRYDCTSFDGRQTFGAIPSEMGGKIIASALFIDFGITDAITDKHRRYASSYTIPLPPGTRPVDTAARTESPAPVAGGQDSGGGPVTGGAPRHEMDPAKRCDACQGLRIP